jgi:riboflavin kinase / FMN adenylyltransferase
MRIYRQISEFTSATRPAATVGVFDGVHLGHREIINRLRKVAAETGCESVVVTFEPHPRLVLPHHADVKLLQTLDEKLQRFSEAGVDAVLVIPFDREFARLSPDDFIRDILVGRLNVSYVITGYDHFFGQNRQGDYDLLAESGRKYGFGVDELPMVTAGAMTVNSSSVRRALLDGDVKTAETMLGYPYSLTGEVVTGNRIGRNIGYPTANLKPNNPNKLIPAQGVYACRVKIGDENFGGMLNIGYRPTLDSSHLTIEVNIFGFDRDIYHQEITIVFADRIRNEKRFASLGDLQLQLAEDRITAEKILSGI